MVIESVNPATGLRFASFEAMGSAELDGILDAAVVAQRRWSKLTYEDRAVPMKRAAQLLRERAAEFARLMALEMGKPLKDGVAEVVKCSWVCDYYADNAASMLSPRPEASNASRSYVRFDPLGVLLAVMPWNYPYWQVFRFIAPHLMAGNAGLLKHASNVPQCALSIESLMRDARFPEDLFRTLLIGAGPVEPLIRDPRIAAVTLTGSEPAGRLVAGTAGASLKPSVLELGGSDAFIVLADADVDAAARAAAAARTMNAGQSCICAKRFIVEAPVYDEFVRKFEAAMSGIRVGDPLDETTDMGPQARVELRDELHAMVRRAVAQGARPAMGCELPSGQGAFYPVSILCDVSRDNVAAQEELFGPVAVVMRASTAEEAIDIANESRFGLGASLWTRDEDKAERFAALIEAGAVYVNAPVQSDPRLPFGGVKASGFGRELGIEGIRSFCNAKTVWIK